MITGLWVYEDGTRVAVQLDEDSILITDYRYDPPFVTSVPQLGNRWEPMPVGVNWIPVEQA